MLTICFLGLLALSIFLVVVESLRYSFERQMNLETMPQDRVLKFFSARERLVNANTRLTSSEASSRRRFGRPGGKGMQPTAEPSEEVDLSDEDIVDAADADDAAPETDEATHRPNPSSAEGEEVHDE